MSASASSQPTLDVKGKRIKFKCVCGLGWRVGLDQIREVERMDNPTSNLYFQCKDDACKKKVSLEELRQIYMMLLLEQSVFLGDDAF